MAILKSGVILEDGENLVMELEAELWAMSTNPVTRFFQNIARVIYAFIGIKKKGFVVITDRRVIEVCTDVICWSVVTGKGVKYVLPSSVKESGYIKQATCCCCCSMYYFYYESFTQSTKILLSGATEEDAQKVATAFYKAISRAQNK